MRSVCCSCGSFDCCTPKTERKEIRIDFLYLDLTVCERCQGTETNLEKAINEVSNVLNSAGYDIHVNKVNVTSEELAVKYQFVSSPTIRINGRDIAFDVKETECRECGELCGDNVDCRVWEYEGEVYNEPPVAMIINAVLKEIYNPSNSNPSSASGYILPENLKSFFRGIR